MKATLEILSLSAGKIDDNDMLYASVMILDGDINHQIDKNRIDVGQKQAKVNVSTQNANVLAFELAKSGLIPGPVICELKTTIKKSVATIEIVGFELPQLQKKTS